MRTLDLLRHANNSEYLAKEQWFYPFKKWLLKTHGTYKGTYTQVINKDCWGCYNCCGCDQIICKQCYGYFCGDFGRRRKCEGDGVFRQNKYRLDAYLIFGHEFLIPSGSIPNPESGLYEHLGVITGRVKHAAVENPKVAVLAPKKVLRKLFWRYQKKLWLEFVWGNFQDWLNRQLKKIPLPEKCILCGWRVFHKRSCPTCDDIPF